MWDYIRIIMISLFFILFIQFFTTYLKNTFLQNKTKDIIGFQTQKYKEIVSNICSQQQGNFREHIKEIQETREPIEKINFQEMENKLTEMFLLE
jgi:hypothetical protein